jgi:peroxiredoxin
MIIVAVLIAIQWYQARPLASGEAPPLKARLTTGEPFDLAAWRGEPVLIHFWASWCPICRLEDGTIHALSADNAVITIAMQSGDAAAVNAHLKERGLGFPVIADPRGEIAARWGVHAVPASFVIDGTGRIRFAAVGYSTGPGLRARLWTAGQLGGQ